MARLFFQKGLTGSFFQKDFYSLTLNTRFSVGLAFASFIFLLLYVFVFSPYENFLYNDMLGFWQRALERLDGKTFIESQFLAWPPWYHIFIAELLRLFNAVGLQILIRFETFLFINILVFAISVFAFHRMALKWFNGDAKFSLAAVVLYGFGFPAWFFNAFLLSDNLSTPLLVIATALFYLKTDMRSLIFAAVLFAFASIVRPSVAPYGLSFVLALFVLHRISLKFIIRAGVFSAVFFALVFLAMTEVSRISKGKVSGLSANGGLDFFIANSEYYRIDLNYDGWHNFVVVPALSWNPEQGFFKTQVPYYYQDYYYGLGWQHIKHDPTVLVRNIGHVKNLFFASMLPSRTDAPGFVIFRPIWDVLKFICFLSAFFFIWLWRDFSAHEKKLAGFMLCTIIVTFIVSYIYTGEPRYTYSLIYLFYLIGLKVLQITLNDREKIKSTLPKVFVLLAALWISGKALAFIATPSYPNHVQAGFSGQSNENSNSAFYLGRLYFPHVKNKALVSVDNSMKLYSPGELVIKTDMLLDGPAQTIKWDVQSSWPIRIKIDNQEFFRSDNIDFFKETPIFYNLLPGKHRVEVIVNYAANDGGLSLSYSYKDKEGWIYREFLGANSGPISFALPQE